MLFKAFFLFLALVDILFVGANHLCNLVQSTIGNIYETIFLIRTIGPGDVVKRYFLEIYLSSGGHFVWRSKSVCTIW